MKYLFARWRMNSLSTLLKTLRLLSCGHRLAAGFTALLILILNGLVGAADNPVKNRDASFEQLVTQTHKESLKLREAALRKTIAKDTCWPPGTWGDNFWCLAALYLNEQVDAANERLLKRANEYLATNATNTTLTAPENPGNLPWTFFSVTDYVRTLYLFHAHSPDFPGRLKPETEAAMKAALWRWVSGESRLTGSSTNDLFLLLGTENIDLNRRAAYYLITALLKEDPAYHDRKLADGHTVAKHADAYTAFFREWPASRAATGLWVEIGAGYEKYSWPVLFNLHELAPDPVIRQRFGRLLDLAFIEEEQISVRGHRGGGISRGDYAGHRAFESYKNLLFAPVGQPAGSSHSRVIETSRYQLPTEAILLRYQTFPAAKPFVIRNRVLGKVIPPRTPDEPGQRLDPVSDLVNYAYRTPHYLLGSTLLDPTLNYSGISNQKRACGMLFDDPATDEICSVHSVIEHGSGGRPQRSFWSVQHENVLILQRIASLGRNPHGSYSTGTVGISFEGKSLQKVETNGWIFASNGKAFVGVKFLDGTYEWDEKHMLATPTNFNKSTDTSRILLHAGDLASHGSFDKFQADVLASPLRVTPDKVDYQFGPATNQLEVTRYDANTPDHFTLPLINGQPVNLRPAKTYQSPYLNADFGSDKIFVDVGPIQRPIDFSKQ